MFVKFKNSEEKFNANTPIEQKLFKGGVAHGWLLSLTFFGKIGSVQADELLSGESISEIVISTEDGGQTVLSGYDKINSCIIKHGDEKNTVEIQLSKEPQMEV